MDPIDIHYMIECLQKIINGDTINHVDMLLVNSIFIKQIDVIKQPKYLEIVTSDSVIINGDIHGSISSLLYVFYIFF